MRGFIAFLLIMNVIVTAALVVPRIVGRSCDGCHSSSLSDMAILKSLLANFQLDTGRYPTTAEGLDALLRSPAGLKKRWKGPYLNRPVRNDPWGYPYLYESDGKSFALRGLGSDGQVGGEGAATDYTLEG